MTSGDTFSVTICCRGICCDFYQSVLFSCSSIMTAIYHNNKINTLSFILQLSLPYIYIIYTEVLYNITIFKRNKVLCRGHVLCEDDDGKNIEKGRGQSYTSIDSLSEIIIIHAFEVVIRTNVGIVFELVKTWNIRRLFFISRFPDFAPDFGCFSKRPKICEHHRIIMKSATEGKKFVEAVCP